MDDFDFTEDEIKEQLEKLGYANVPDERLTQFKRDLEHLVKHERSKNSSTCTSSSAEDSTRGRLFHGKTYTAKTAEYDPPRHPLDEASNRHPGSRSNGPVIDYAAFDKENYEDTHLKQRDPPRDKTSFLPSHRPPAIHIPTPAVDPSLPEDHFHHRDYDHYLNFDPQALADTSITSTTSSDRRVMKRRVVRKKDGHSEISDEQSILESDTDELTQRLHDLGLTEPVRRPHTAPVCHRPLPEHQPYSRPHSRTDPPAFRLPDDYEGPKALIRPMSAAPHTKNIRKSDPVARYQRYREQWQMQRAPGEKQHKNLRWNVREQMLYKDDVVQKKNHRVFVPNKYVIPSDKKRKNLRWNIRNDLAQGVVPPSLCDYM